MISKNKYLVSSGHDSFILMIVVFLSLLSFHSNGQVLSPNSSSSANLSAATTGPYTGKPNISIPVTGLSGKQVSIPVSLYYNASGVRIEELGSWVGLGWNLDVGGAITRTVNGIDDFSLHGYFQYGSELPAAIGPMCEDGTENYYNYVKGVINESRDAEPDIYNVSLPGFSAQFYFDQGGIPYTIPRQKVKIEKPVVASGEWTITTTDGFVYKFGGTGFNEISEEVVNTWHLKEIISPLGEHVNFFYTSQNTSYSLLPSELSLLVANTTCGSIDEDLTFDRDIDITGLFLDRIEAGDSKLEFVLGDRCDVKGKKLDKVLLKEGNEIVKEYHFDFECDPVKQRLWLTAFREIGSNSLPLPPHRFEYNDKNSLPGLLSYAQDHWGFYNGQNDNTSLIPSYIESNFSFSGGNRSPDNVSILKGVLSQIHFPLGGSTEYTFEANDYGNYVDQYPEVSEVLVSYQASAGNRSDMPLNDGSDQFTINTATTVTFDNIVDRLGQVSTGDHYVRLTKGGSTIFTATESGSRTILLQPGVYTIVASIGANDPAIYLSEVRTSFKLLTAESSALSARYGGGIRVKKILTNDGIGNSDDIIHTYDYTNFTDNETSGKLMSGPVYHYKIRSHCGPGYSDYKVFSSTSAIPLSSAASGAYVGYDNVTVYYEEGQGEGKTEYTYINNASAFRESSTVFGVQRVPYTPTEGDWYKNGLLDLRKDYRYYQGSFHVQAIEDPTYRFESEKIIKGLVIAEEQVFYQKCQNLFHTFYEVKSAWIQLDRVISYQYDGDATSAGPGIFRQVDYEYDSTEPWLLKKQLTTNSDGVEYITEYKYPHDFSTSTFNGAIGGMISDYIFSPAIQQIQSRRESGTTKVTGTRVTEFGSVGLTYLPVKVHGLEIANPVTNFSFNSSNPIADGRFREQVSYSYDTDGNLLETERGAQKSSTIIGYDDDLSMAQVANAGINEIAYTGFETDDKGNWNYTLSGSTSIVQSGFTGDQSFTGNINASVPPGNYMVSLWGKGSGFVSVSGVSKPVSAEWSQLVWNINTSGTIYINTGSSANIDELRLHPVDAMMTSYTYDPTIGVVAVAGTDGRAQISEYDDYDRLKLVKDFKGNIRNTNTYNLQSTLHGEILGENPTLNTSSYWSLALGEDLPSGIICIWDFGDGSGSEGLSTNHTYSKLGFFEVKVTLSKPGYETVVERRLIKVEGELTASINNTESLPNTAFSLWVTDHSANPEGAIYTWSINETSGEPKTGTDGILHSYQFLGVYQMSVTVDHKDYPSVTIHKDITVLGEMTASWNPPPGSPPSLLEDEVFNFLANKGINPADAVYDWSFGRKGSSIYESLPTIGNTDVTLTVTHPGYATKTRTKNITINPDVPKLTAARSLGDGGVLMAVDNGLADFKYEWRIWQQSPFGLGGWSGWFSHTSAVREHFIAEIEISTTIQCRVTDRGGNGNTSPIISLNGMIEGGIEEEE